MERCCGMMTSSSLSLMAEGIQFKTVSLGTFQIGNRIYVVIACETVFRWRPTVQIVR